MDPTIQFVPSESIIALVVSLVDKLVDNIAQIPSKTS
jgi:hypothetical protein